MLWPQEYQCHIALGPPSTQKGRQHRNPPEPSYSRSDEKKTKVPQLMHRGDKVPKLGVDTFAAARQLGRLLKNTAPGDATRAFRVRMTLESSESPK